MTAGRTFEIRVRTIMVGDREVVDPDTVQVKVFDIRPGKKEVEAFDPSVLDYVEFAFESNRPESGVKRRRFRRHPDEAITHDVRLSVLRVATDADIPPAMREIPLAECDSIIVAESSSNNISLNNIRGMLK